MDDMLTVSELAVMGCKLTGESHDALLKMIAEVEAPNRTAPNAENSSQTLASRKQQVWCELEDWCDQDRRFERRKVQVSTCVPD